MKENKNYTDKHSIQQDCGIVRDLLPLYIDEICSEESKRFVERHLEGCASCRALYQEMKNSELETVLKSEKDEVLKRHAKKEKGRAYRAGLIISGLLLLPIIIAGIAAAAGGAEFRSIPVLAASMLLVAAVTAVPLLSESHRLARVITVGTASVLLIEFFVTLLYSGRVDFAVLASTMFGLSIPFFPLFLRYTELPEMFRNRKALITMSWDTIWFYLMLFADAGTAAAFRLAAGVSTYFVLTAWIIFGITQIRSLARISRMGLSILVFCVMISSCAACSFATSQSVVLTAAVALFRAPWTYSDAHVRMCILYAGIAICGGCVLAGWIAKIRRSEQSR
ncbi:zf-HC2 domain-containing protein [Eubacterium pyruvativorans]|uniref:zf-HC2 domain-containing protein n=1 Tax=Eubacterium pyruvativorans TaxID=155865 RepID=UPI00240A2E08|nr:anti-sigma factor [Eubacterium pyruvativorans]MDD6707628.1 anti-sigma factor [Eubacterium pyruvativorans]